MVTAEDFPAFFAAVNGDRPPFSWQQRLVDHILTYGRWPDRINAPTGSGKSSVIEVHVFVNAVTASAGGIRPPRRLVAAVDRRALVDSQYDRALALRRLLAEGRSEVLARVADALRGLATNSGAAGQTSWLPVVSLRGGQQNTAIWRDDPAACGIVCATPDMWGSRALFRGYGTSLRARPRDAGLLTVDTVVVIDEAHLNRQLLQTARRIGQLQDAVEPVGVPGLQVVETTATPATDPREAGLTEVGVREDDLITPSEADSALARRLLTPKPLELIPCAAWPGNSAPAAKAVATLLADRARMLKSERSGTVGVFVNTVKRALEVAELLRLPVEPTGAAPVVAVVAGPMRPFDREDLTNRRWPGLLSVAGNASVDFLVATQTLEVGVDLDLSAAVTELAPADSIVQRVGRVNRIGRQDDPKVEVIVPESAEPARLDGAGPYLREDLLAGLTWLRERSEHAQGLATWAVSQDVRPPTSARRVLYRRLEAADADVLAATSQPLFDEFDLELWLHDDLDHDDDQSFLVVRERLPVDANQALAVLRATPPLDAECFPVTLGTLRALFPDEREHRAFRFRAGQVEELMPGSSWRPGDIAVVDSSVPVVREDVVHPDPQRPAVDVYERVRRSSDGYSGVRIMPFTDRDEQGADPYRALLIELAGVVDQDARDTANRRRQMADSLERTVEGVSAALDTAAGEALTEATRGAARALRCAKYLTEVASGRDDNGALAWVVVTPLTRRFPSALRQVVSPSDQAVPLDAHGQAVGRRAALIGEAVGVAPDLVAALRWAGQHHDDGKRDRRFQTMLGNPNQSEEPWAKSSQARTAVAHRREAHLSPAGWRHEQLSVVIASRDSTVSVLHRDLALRLVGTSHGHGRPFFPHAASELVHGTDGDLVPTASRMFDRGGWDDLLDATQARWGPWGCAYLEAVLRAADCQVSAEGS